MTLFEVLRSPEEKRQSPRLTFRGVTAGAKGYLLARLYAEHRWPLLIVTPDARQRDVLVEDLRCFLEGIRLPSGETRAGDAVVWSYRPRATAPAGTIASLQEQALYAFQPLWRLLCASPGIVVTAVESLRYRVIPPASLQQASLSLRVGMVYPLQQLIASLVEHGYRRVPLVETVGEFAVRGGIVDCFAPGQTHPLRLEFFGDEIDTIRTFALQSQLSVAPLQEAVITPMHPLPRQHRDEEAGWQRVREWLQDCAWSPARIETYIAHWEQQAPGEWPWGLAGCFYDPPTSVLAYLPPTGLLCSVDTEDLWLTLQQLPAPAEMTVGEAAIPLPAEHLIPLEALTGALQERLDVALVQYAQPSAALAVRELRLRGAPQFLGSLERFIAQMRLWLSEAYCVLLLCHFPLEIQHMQALLAEYDLGGQVLTACAACLSDAVIRPGAVLFALGEISQGFVFPELPLVVLRMEDVFGEKQRGPAAASAPPRRARIDFGALRPGDRVVHADYGIGIYRRMTCMDVGHEGGEFMELEYAEGAKLYVPADRLSMVQKYLGGGEHDEARLDRLGGTSWSRTKERVKASLLAMAEDLVRLHATRQARPGHGFSGTSSMHHEFASRFEYTETEDQLRAIQQVTADMERPQAMDRLVCGDVGYGKTEVAMRAAFKAVYDSKQVAVLVPTTVLAQQHYDTFQRRFAAYPVEVAVLSRLRGRKEQQRILDGLRAGSVDIVIGTHRLLQKDVQFKDLGLLIVDEEHRFGVAHKERIKQLSTQVDILTLTATPIPRSLHMSLVGLRDFSMIETPPEGRSAIETVVVPFSEETVQQAIQQELARGGQIFFVHNHIDTLPALQAMIARLVPTCRVGVVHGQMPEAALEKVMLRFLAREFDLLLCTTIIESGLDIPAANTIIINQADRFGLAQLYQLRGRVGRSTRQAYAYLLIPGQLVLSDLARKRVEAIEEFSALGSSFQLAARDLEIRGAGNLLGAQQSGHIASIGFQLYCQLLDEAIRTTRGEEVPVRVDPELRLEVPGYLPPEYVHSEAQRLELYQRLAAVEDEAVLAGLRQELQDRFGAFPEVVQRLIAIVEIKIVARRLALERVEYRRGEVCLTFHPQTPVQPEQVLAWLQSSGAAFRFPSERVACVAFPVAAPDVRLAGLKKRLQQLWSGASMSITHP